MEQGMIEERGANAGTGARARIRRAGMRWIALGVLGLVAGCGGDETQTSTSGASGASGAAGTTGAGASTTGGGPAALCSIGVRDVIVSEGAGSSPAVAYAGNHYLVVWTSTVKDAGDIRAALLDDKGAKVTEQVVTEGLNESAFPTVIPDAGSGYLVVWQDKAVGGAMVKARHLDAQGVPQGAAFQLAQSTSADARPGAAPALTGTAIAWADKTMSTVGLLNGEMISAKSPINQGAGPALAAAGGTLGVTWSTGSKVGAAFLASPGAPLTPILFRDAAGAVNAPRVTVHDDGSLAVAWEDNRAGDGNESIYLARIDKSGKAGPEKRVPASTESANYPDVVWTGSHDAVVYYQFRDGPPAIYLSLLTPDLTARGPDLKLSGDGIPARYPRVARTGDTLGTLGVVYAEKEGRIRATLVACP